MKIEQNNFQQPSKPLFNKIIKNIIPNKEPKSNFIKYLCYKINFFKMSTQSSLCINDFICISNNIYEIFK